MLSLRISLLAVALFASCIFPTVADDKEPPAQQQTQTILLGPFFLGDFYAKESAHEELVKHYGRENTPSEDAIVRAMNRCEIFVGDKSVVRANGTRGFFETADRVDPTVLVRGELQFVVPNSKGQAFTFQLTKTGIKDLHTEEFDDSSGSWRKIRFRMHFAVSAKVVQKFPEIEWNISHEKLSVVYDVHGKLIDPPARK